MFENMSAIIDGKIIVNVTPHPLTFLSKSGETVIVPTSVPEGERTSPWVVNATAVEKPIGEDLVTTVFLPTPEGKAILDCIERWAEEQQYNVRIIGSIIAAQAYPGRILNVIPAPGFERVPPAEKRMTTERFTVFKTDGYVDFEDKGMEEVAKEILENALRSAYELQGEEKA